MQIGMADMTNINGTFSLFLTAETAAERAKLEELRRRLKPVEFTARGLDPAGTGEELLVIPLEHLLMPKVPKTNPLIDPGFKTMIDGLDKRRE